MISKVVITREASHRWESKKARFWFAKEFGTYKLTQTEGRIIIIITVQTDQGCDRLPEHALIMIILLPKSVLLFYKTIMDENSHSYVFLANRDQSFPATMRWWKHQTAW